MIVIRSLTTLAVALALTAAILLGQPSAGRADIGDTACTIAGNLSGLVGKACNLVSKGGRVLKAGKELIGGHVGKAFRALTGAGGAAASLVNKGAFFVGLAAVTDWVINGARLTLGVTEQLLNRTARPDLNASWFSGRYWRMAGIGALLTLPFLFAGLVQCVVRADGADLARSVLGYLPLSLLLVAIAAPLTTLLLSATDGLSAAVASATGGSGQSLSRGLLVGGFLAGSTAKPFIGLLLGMLVVSAGVLLWLEMLVRDAAIYVVVLMLPLVFAGMVWPARRGWTIRAAELLVALILSKFVVVAVLWLGASALSSSGGGLGALMAGLVLLTLSAAAPWALMRLLPLTEVAATVGSHLRADSGRLVGRLPRRAGGSDGADEPLSSSDGLGPLPDGSQENAQAVRGRMDALSGGGHDRAAPAEEIIDALDSGRAVASEATDTERGPDDAPATDGTSGADTAGGDGADASAAGAVSETFGPVGSSEVPPQWAHLPTDVSQPPAPGEPSLAEELPGLFLADEERFVLGDDQPGSDDNRARRVPERTADVGPSGDEGPLPRPQEPPEGAL